MKPKLEFERRFRELKFSDFKNILFDTVLGFFQEKALFHGAAIAFYVVFAAVPIVYLALISFGAIIGEEAIMNIISSLLKEQVGISDPSAVMEFLQTSNFQKNSFILNVISIVAVLFTSTILLASLRYSMNEFLDVEVNPLTGRKKFVTNMLSRLISVGVLFVLVLVVVIAYFAQIIFSSLGSRFFGDSEIMLWMMRNFTQEGIPIITFVLMFTVVFKYVHDGYVNWKLAFIGSLFTTMFLVVGQYVLKIYLTKFFFISQSGGVAAALLVLLTWVYYSSQILFFGAKFISVTSRYMMRKSI